MVRPGTKNEPDRVRPSHDGAMVDEFLAPRAGIRRRLAPTGTQMFEC
jgi:hypothetical protein